MQHSKVQDFRLGTCFKVGYCFQIQGFRGTVFEVLHKTVAGFKITGFKGSGVQGCRFQG